MRIAIIDDEKTVREATRTLLNIYAPNAEIVGEAGSVADSISLIKTTQPSLVLLDIEIQNGTGFDVLNAFPDRTFHVIFITAFNDYAIKAFKFAAVDYILKPLDPEELSKALQKSQRQMDLEGSGIQMRTLETNLKLTKSERIILKDADNLYLVNVGDIVRCESQDNYTKFYLTDGRKLLISTTLKDYEALFTDHGFFRCHQSHLINLHHFQRYDKREGGQIYMKDGSSLPVSTRRKDMLMKALESL